jgi:hypothetical protein
MPHNINTRLAALQARRTGTDRLPHVAMDSQGDIVTKSFVPEQYQKRATDKPYTRYALGTMQEVSADYTRISLETARRVGRQIYQALTASGLYVDFRLQGSVPLNVHIRGISDVDLLTLDTSFYTYAPAGRRSQMGFYTSPSVRTSVGVLSLIRTHVQQTLRTKYPEADLDVSGRKAVKISGGSLARPVDVVPAHWYDTIRYQQSEREADRCVTILDHKSMQTIDNLPFLHIALVETMDKEVYGSLKKAIRLCKNVRSDAESEIALPSFDIAALMYHADKNALTAGFIYELNILAETQRYLDFLYSNKEYAFSLKVPDGSRHIIDSEAKFGALTSLSIEMDDLLRRVANEQSSILARKESPSRFRRRTS